MGYIWCTLFVHIEYTPTRYCFWHSWTEVMVTATGGVVSFRSWLTHGGYGYGVIKLPHGVCLRLGNVTCPVYLHKGTASCHVPNFQGTFSHSTIQETPSMWSWVPDLSCYELSFSNEDLNKSGLNHGTVTSHKGAHNILLHRNYSYFQISLNRI